MINAFAVMQAKGALQAFHRIAPEVEEYPVARLNEAVERLRSGAARYRVVLNMRG